MRALLSKNRNFAKETEGIAMGNKGSSQGAFESGLWFGFYRDNFVQLLLNPDGTFEHRDADFDVCGAIAVEVTYGTWVFSGSVVQLKSTNRKQFSWSRHGFNEDNWMHRPVSSTIDVPVEMDDNQPTLNWPGQSTYGYRLKMGSPEGSLQAVKDRGWGIDDDMIKHFLGSAQHA